MGKKRLAANMLASLGDEQTAERFDRVDELREQLLGKRPTDAPGASPAPAGGKAAPAEKSAPAASQKAAKPANQSKPKKAAAKTSSPIAGAKEKLKQPSLPLEQGPPRKVTGYLNPTEAAVLHGLNLLAISKGVLRRTNESHIIKAMLAWSQRLPEKEKLDMLRAIPVERTGPKSSK